MKLRTGPRPALLGLLPVASLLCAAPFSLAGEDRKPPPPVSCTFAEERGTLTVRLRDEKVDLRLPPGLPSEIREEFREALEEFRQPGSATIQRRADDIVVLGDSRRSSFFGDSGGRGPIACEGGVPTVANTDTIRVRKGARAKNANLKIDLTYGRLEPGATDEGDGSSEIELDAAVGGRVAVRMTRGADPVTLGRGASGTSLNLNAAELTADDDLVVDEESRIQVDGAGSADSIELAEGGSASELRGLTLTGGQGDDLLRAGSDMDRLFPGTGRDRVEAGGGSDLVIAFESAPDRIDCGGGMDFVLISEDSRHGFHDCEHKLSPRDLRRPSPTPPPLFRGAVRHQLRSH